jgi:hypothetical protein
VNSWQGGSNEKMILPAIQVAFLPSYSKEKQSLRRLANALLDLSDQIDKPAMRAIRHIGQVIREISKVVPRAQFEMLA